MKYTFLLVLTSLALVTLTPSCAKYGCPSNTEAYTPKVKKKSKLQTGLVPSDYAKKRGITGKATK